MNGAATLERDMIAQTHLWRLAMLVGDSRIDVALLPPVDTEMMLYRSIQLNKDADSVVKAIEDAIYANPLLLSDFKSVTCLLDTPESLTVPAGLSDEERELLLRRAFTIADDEAVNSVVNAVGDAKAEMLTSIDDEIKGFLCRTFFNLRFEHQLAPLCRFLMAQPSEGRTLYAVCRQDAIDLVAVEGGNLLTANSFATDSAADAAYCILATANTLGGVADTTFVVGVAEPLSSQVTAQLTQVPNVTVLPIELPAACCKLPAGASEIPLQLLYL